MEPEDEVEVEVLVLVVVDDEDDNNDEFLKTCLAKLGKGNDMGSMLDDLRLDSLTGAGGGMPPSSSDRSSHKGVPGRLPPSSSPLRLRNRDEVPLGYNGISLGESPW